MSHPLPLPRVRFTIRHLMIAVAVVAGLMALAYVPGFAGVGGGMALAMAGTAWFVTRRHPRLALGAFVAAAAWANLSLLVFYALMPHLRGHAGVVLLLGALLALPLAVGCGVARAEGRPGWRAKGAAALLVVAVVAGPASMIAWRWPFFLAFRISAPALDRLADRLDRGEPLDAPEWAGVYRVIGAKRAPDGTLALVVGRDFTGDSSFLRGGPWGEPMTPAHAAPRWSYWDED